MRIVNLRWTRERGKFRDEYFVDERKTDYVIKWKNGTVSKQLSRFADVFKDWNNDGEVYCKFGAYFEGLYGGEDFISPQQMVNLMLDNKATIDGIEEVKK